MIAQHTIALLASATAGWGLSLSPAQLDQFATYTTELQHWNQRVNLTAITDSEEIAIRHMLDSLRCALSWGTQPQTLVDVGSGAGFPGLPLKLLCPVLHLTLIDSVAKKTTFLEHMVSMLALDHVTVLTMRAEAAGRDPQQREQYDVATARAVADIRVVAEYCLPLVRPGGRLLLPKGGDIADEVAEAQAAMSLLGGELAAVEPVALPGLEPRTLVVITKSAPTPMRYPRAPGVPARRPLPGQR